jgi:hypothetical protein
MRRVAIATAVFALFSSAISAASAQTTTGSQLNPCAVPNEVGASFEEAAWQIFVAATCPVNNDQYPFVVWENWIEQALLYPADPSNGLQVPNSGAPTVTHTLHNSLLTIRLSPGLAVTVPGLNGALDAACNKAATPPRSAARFFGLLRNACDDSLSPIILTAQRDGWVFSETKDDRHEARRAHARVDWKNSLSIRDHRLGATYIRIVLYDVDNRLSLVTGRDHSRSGRPLPARRAPGGQAGWQRRCERGRRRLRVSPH